MPGLVERIDFERAVDLDTLITRPPISVSGNLELLGWLDDKVDWIMALYRGARRLSRGRGA